MENQAEVQSVVKVFTLGNDKEKETMAEITIYRNSPPVCYRRIINTHDVIIRFWNVRLERFVDVGIPFINVVGSLGEVEYQAYEYWRLLKGLIESAHSKGFNKGMKKMMNKAIEVMNNMD